MNEILKTSRYEKPETKKHDAMNTVQGSFSGGLYYYYTSLYTLYTLYKLYYYH